MRAGMTAVVAACIAAFLVAGCGGSASAHAALKHVDLHGFVSAAGHVNGASVVLFDAAGKQIATTTTRNGMFHLADVSLPTDFSVKATNGAIAGQAATGALRLDVSGYKPGRDLYVNQATTLAAAYRDAHPTHTVAEADNTVRIFLGLPDWAKLGPSLVGSLPQFDPKKFAKAAQENGGLDSYESKLVKEIDAGHTTAGPRFPVAAQNDLVDDAAEFVISNLLKGAGSAAANKGMSAFMNAIGQGGPDISGQISQISSQLDDIQGSLTTLSQEVQGISLQDKYSSIGTVGAIESATEKMSYVATDPTTESDYEHSVDCTGLELWGITPTNGPDCSDIQVGGTWEDLADAFGKGNNTSGTLPDLWDAYYKSTHSSRFYSDYDAQNLLAQYKVWESLVSAQWLIIDTALNQYGTASEIEDANNELNKLMCESLGDTPPCPSGITVGSLAIYDPPQFPTGGPGSYFEDTANQIMWSDGFVAHSDDHYEDEWDSWDNQPGVEVELYNPAQGADWKFVMAGWDMPSYWSMVALFANGTTPLGEWLYGQTHEGTAINSWDGYKLWSSSYWPIKCCTTPTVLSLDSGSIDQEPKTHYNYSIGARSLYTDANGNTEQYTPYNW